VRRALLGAAACAALALAPSAAHADARATAEAARVRVVKITAVFGGDTPETKHGFGFVAGERDGFLYVATANHVVRSDLDDAPAGTATVQFFTDQGVSYPATVLATHRRAPLDLAVIKVARPASPLGPASCDDSRALRRNMPVAYVGRDAGWYVPTDTGAINSDTLDEGFHVEVDFSRAVAVKEGTSGAPLVSERGLIGMIIQDTSTNVATALSIDAIARAFRGWNHPWAAGLCPLPPPPLADSGFDLGVRAGLGRAFGRFSGYSDTISSQIDSIAPLALEGMYRLTSDVSVGVLFQYAPAQLDGNGCGDVGAINCSGKQIAIDVMGRYRRRVGGRLAGWAGLGAGYEWLEMSGNTRDYDHHGFEVARLEAGGDVAVTDRLTVGPLVSLSLARFEWAKDTGDMNDPGWQDLGNPTNDKRRWHSWLIVGVRAAITVFR
jgi:hypothetical protein